MDLSFHLNWVSVHSMIAGLYRKLCKKTAKLSSKVIIPCHIPTSKKMRVRVAPHSCQHLVLSIVLHFSHCKRCGITVIICSPLMTFINDVEHLFIFNLPLDLWWNVCSYPLPIFKLSYLFSWSFKRSLYKIELACWACWACGAFSTCFRGVVL